MRAFRQTLTPVRWNSSRVGTTLSQKEGHYEDRGRKPLRNRLSCVVWHSHLAGKPTHHLDPGFVLGVEAPSIGNCNTISTRARVHHTARLTNYCVIGPGTLLVPEEDETLEEYTVVYGAGAERRTWSGRGKVQEADLRNKHLEYLREMLPKFNRLRTTADVAMSSPGMGGR